MKFIAELLGKDNPDAKEALLKKYQLPFEVIDPAEEDDADADAKKRDKPFLKCRYNRVGDRHRSPWTGRLYPGGGGEEGGKKAGSQDDDDEIRILEGQFNAVWDSYRNLYYGSSAEVSAGSVFLQKSQKEGSFEGVFGISKKCDAGSWDSIHFVHAGKPYVEVENDKEVTKCKYIVDTTVLVVLVHESSDGKEGDAVTTSADTSAYLSKETSRVCKMNVPSMHVDACHIENIGEIIEGNEIDVRSNVERIYIPKARDVVDDICKKAKDGGGQPKIPTMVPGVGVNPLMGMVMNSDMLKKRRAQLSDD